ncbi:hypothetical protein GBF38_009179 [Nibea albiflora]|uniref:Uncharacterized protein n=1 Tax=Nibea albiflora TaxID=240163 RepID=A0ACB7EPW7_NIBAL|nr:hypothetical protein GBF38_009179 [Nibea albiflora]
MFSDISSCSTDVSETDGAAKSHKPDTRRKRRETRQSPFKVPDSNSVFLKSMNEKEDRKEEMRKFLALPIHEKKTQTARTMAKLTKELVEQVEEDEEEQEEEEKEKMKNQKQIKSRTVLPKETPRRHQLKMAMMKRENFTKESKHDLMDMERQKAVLELSLMTKRSEITRMDKAIAKEEAQLEQLGKIIERDNLHFEEFLRENEKKSVEARAFFEQEARSKQEKNAEIKKLTAEIVTIKGEMERFEETLVDYKRYKDLLFKLSPPEWQEAQKTKALKAKEKKKNREPEESATGNGKYLVQFKSKITDSKPDSDSSEYEDEPELYFTNPQQLLDLVTELTEQNLSLIQNSTRVEETLEELQQSLEITRKKIEKDEEQLTLQINDMKQRIDKEKSRGAKLKQMVQLHISLNTEDQDVMLDALGEKVAEVHCSCVDERMTNLSTVEKLANIENHMSSLLENLEGIPGENLEMMKKIKDSEKRTRSREEKLVEQKEKQKERMRRYLERSLADSKKVNVRKLMPRCMPVAQKVKVSHVDSTPAQDEFYASLYTYDDVE